MAVSYSFHISSKSHALTNIGKVGQVSRHNLREYKSADYDKELIDVLIGSNDNLLNDIKRVYHEEFDEALERYNAKQKRADRQINDYLNHVSESRGDVAVEIIVQIGDKNFWGDKSLSDKKRMSLIFKDQLKALNTYCPDFKVSSAVVHYDESSPHMHIVGVPIAKGYKKGMEVQCAKTKVFTKESLSFLQDKMRERAEIGMSLFPQLFGDGQLKEKEKGRNKDIPKASLDEYYELKAKVKEQTREIDDISRLIANKGNKEKKVENYTIPEKKSLFGKIEAPERQGAFIEGMNKEQVKALMQSVSADESLATRYHHTAERCQRITSKAKQDAEIIRSEATAEKNQTIAAAQDVLNQKSRIIQAANEFADKIKRQYKELLERVNSLLKQKDELELEISQLNASRGKLEPLKQEVEELTRAKKIMSGELNSELTRARFKSTMQFKFNEDYWKYRDSGQLIALYKDGTQRVVGKNENGGFDNKTLADMDKGLCDVGVFLTEPNVRVPQSLIKELLHVRDKELPISQGLKNFIQQQEDVGRTVNKHRGISR